jgi:tRNA threonylcarbamoyladenosine biosynthesis protein TsaE
MIIATASVTETRKVGQMLGKRLREPVVIALWGELGAGKTAFVQGLARGLGVPENQYVTSPTYTLINEYSARMKLYHVDLYRLESSDDFENIGLFDLFSEDGVIAIEWPQKLAADLPDERIDIGFDVTGQNSRCLLLTPCGHKAEDLLQGLA